MDIADIATDLIEAERDDALRRATEPLARRGQTHCLRCGDVIPLARSRALPSATRCVDCQTDLESEPQ